MRDILRSVRDILRLPLGPLGVRETVRCARALAMNGMLSGVDVDRWSLVFDFSFSFLCYVLSLYGWTHNVILTYNVILTHIVTLTYFVILTYILSPYCLDIGILSIQ